MRQPSKTTLRFVRALLGGIAAVRDGETFRATADAGAVALPATDVRELIAQGVLDGDASTCRANTAMAQWLKRQMLEPTPLQPSIG